MTRLKGFVGPTYTLRSVNADCQRCVNLYPEINELGAASNGEIGTLVGRPGLRLLTTCGDGPVRGIYTAATGVTAIVSGSGVYRLSSNNTATLVGNLNTSTGRVGMADNGTQMVIVDGAYGYILSLSTGTLTQITSPNFPGADTVTFQDGYFLFNNPKTGQFFFCALYDGFTYDALDFITAEGSPDNLVAVLSSQRQLWAVGTKTIEVWFNSGGNPPFARIDGAFIEYGCGAPFTFSKYANSVMWLGGGEQGAGIVWQAVGYQPKRISNHSVELAIQSYGDVSNATAWVHQVQGHIFYTLNFPSANTSWVYDLSTGQWHERTYLNANGVYERERAECYTYANGLHIVGDYQNGKIYALDYATFTDAGDEIRWMRRAPRLSANLHRVRFDKFQLDAGYGVGLDGAPAVGVDPQVELRISDDYGHTWRSAGLRSLGQIGEYGKRAIWRRLGMGRNRVFEISGSDPVSVTILGAEIDVVEAAS